MTNKKIKHDIAEDARNALKVISDAAAEAVKVVASATAEATKINNEKGSADHDLVVSLNVKMDDLRLAVKELSDKDGSYVLKDDFNFWRNLLVTGILLTIFISVVSRFLLK